MSAALGVALGAALGALSLGCDPIPQDRPDLIDRLRVLTLRAQPLVASQDEPAQLSALVRSPSEQAPQVQWSWCPYRARARDSYRCPVTRQRYEELIRAAAARFELELEPDALAGLPDLELPAGAQPTLTHGLSPERAFALCALTALAALEVDRSLQPMLHTTPCEIGFEISLRADVRQGSGQGQDRLVTRKSTLWDTGAATRLRHPTLLPLQIRPKLEVVPQELAALMPWLDQGVPYAERWAQVPEDGVLALARGLVYEVRGLVDLETLDPYLRTQPQPDRPLTPDEPEPGYQGEEDAIVLTEDGLERTRFRWFSSDDVLRDADPPEGVFDEEREPRTRSYRLLDLSASGAGAPLARCAAQPRCALRLEVLVTDTQLGVTWRSVQAAALTPAAAR